MVSLSDIKPYQILEVDVSNWPRYVEVIQVCPEYQYPIRVWTSYSIYRNWVPLGFKEYQHRRSSINLFEVIRIVKGMAW